MSDDFMRDNLDVIDMVETEDDVYVSGLQSGSGSCKKVDFKSVFLRCAIFLAVTLVIGVLICVKDMGDRGYVFYQEDGNEMTLERVVIGTQGGQMDDTGMTRWLAVGDFYGFFYLDTARSMEPNDVLWIALNTDELVELNDMGIPEVATEPWMVKGDGLFSRVRAYLHQAFR